MYETRVEKSIDFFVETRMFYKLIYVEYMLHLPFKRDQQKYQGKDFKVRHGN